MLDEKGIYLAEVNRRIPREEQILGYDVLMDVDPFNKPKVISTFQMCVNSILTLLFMKPGQYPSIPELGMDIEQYLHEYADDKRLPDKIKSELNEQCNRIELSGVTFECEIDKMTDGTNALVITITGSDLIYKNEISTNVVIGISYDKLNRLYINKRYI